MSDMDTEVKDGADDKRVYELSFLLVPKIEEGDLGVAYTNLKDMVASFGGEMIASEMPKMTPLAYSMLKVVSNVRNKYNSAYFGWVKFFIDAEKVLELKKKLDFEPNVIRFLILKTVKENTIATKRFVGRDSAYRKNTPKKTDEEKVVSINKEEVDREIDAMVAV